MPAKNDFSCDDLLRLIGLQVSYHGHHCEIIELIDDCSLVLQQLETGSHIQPSQYGEGHRTVPVTYTVPVFDAEGELHPELVAAGLAEALRQHLSDTR